MRIALWGAFDVDTVEPHATRRVVEHGLLTRLPGCEVIAFAPLGERRPLALDGGRPSHTLPPPEPERLGELARSFDCILVCGADALVGADRAGNLWGDPAAAELMIDGLGPNLETVCPVVWAGVALEDPPDPATADRIAAVAGRRRPIAVLDEGSRRLLAGTGDGVEVVPPYALALPAGLDPSLLRLRTAFLELAGWMWPRGTSLSVLGNGAWLEAVPRIASALLPLVNCGTLRVQLAATGRLDGEDEFAGALEAALDGRCRRLPGIATVEDLTAIVEGSVGLVGPPGIGLWLAAALGVPSTSPRSPRGGHDALLAELGVSRPAIAGLGDEVSSLPGRGRDPGRSAAVRERVERQLDAVAGTVAAAACRRTRVGRGDRARAGREDLLDGLREAHDARGRQLLAERRAFQAAEDAAVAELHAALRSARDDADRLRSELAAANAANDRMVASRTWRYTQPLRDSLAWVRERRR